MRNFRLLAFLFLTFSLLGYSGKTETVVDIIINSENHQILENAVITAGLAEALQEEGPFTVFAPTNAAFAALLAELGAASLDDIDVATLEAVLKMHVLSGKVMSGDLSEGLTAETLFGQSISFSLVGGASITDPAGRKSNITAVDIEAQNGVVHVIDKVILPDLTTTNITERLKPRMNFYPNPAAGYIIIHSDKTGGILRISNISGKQVHVEEIIQQEQKIDLTGVIPGMYFISLEINNSRVTEKLIVR